MSNPNPNKKNRFKPGQSGNKKGRPLGSRSFKTNFYHALAKLGDKNDKKSEELLNDIMQQAISRARKGDFRFFKDLMDRLHGTAIHNQDIKSGGKRVKAINVNFVDYSGDDGK